MSYMFYNCVALTTLDLGNFDTSAVTSMSYMFYNCVALTTITGVISGIKISLSFSSSPLSRESALVIINGLADLTGETAQTLTLSSTTKVLLTDADACEDTEICGCKLPRDAEAHRRGKQTDNCCGGRGIRHHTRISRKIKFLTLKIRR
jgi:surface protein